MALVVGTNSYGSRAEGDAYFLDSLRKENWNNFNPTLKDQALIEVTRVFERQGYEGEKEVSSQALAFPRTGLKDKDGNDLTGSESLVTMKDAQFEYALFLLEDIKKLGARDSTGKANIKGVGAGSAKVDFFRPQKAHRFPLAVQELIGIFITGAGTLSGGLASGTGDLTSFDTEYGTTRGYP